MHRRFLRRHGNLLDALLREEGLAWLPQRCFHEANLAGWGEMSFACSVSFGRAAPPFRRSSALVRPRAPNSANHAIAVSMSSCPPAAVLVAAFAMSQRYALAQAIFSVYSRRRRQAGGLSQRHQAGSRTEGARPRPREPANYSGPLLKPYGTRSRRWRRPSAKAMV
jgi:hypothetical protein